MSSSGHVLAESSAKVIPDQVLEAVSKVDPAPTVSATTASTSAKGHHPLPLDGPILPDNTPAMLVSDSVDPAKTPFSSKENDPTEIASNVQELSVTSEDRLEALGEEELMEETKVQDGTGTGAGDATKKQDPAMPVASTGAQPPTTATVSGTALPNGMTSATQPRAPITIDNSAVERVEMVDDKATEQTASYTSPNHEWARILQRRFGKNLTDAQSLARSNSMLASPSILAQSLNQIIPALQIKAANAGLSPGSPSRDQTAEELFDRLPTMEASPSPFAYEDQPKDEAFPSSEYANNSKAPLLLFSPLNPDQLFGKSSHKKNTPLPTSPILTKLPHPQPQAQPQPQPQPQLKQQLAEVVSSTQQQLPSTSQPALQPANIAPQPIPVERSSPISIPPGPSVPVVAEPSPSSLSHLVSPSSNPVRQSPQISREQVANVSLAPPSQPKALRQNIVTTPALEDPTGQPPSSTSAAKPLVAQGSSSSLVAAQGPSLTQKDPTNVVSGNSSASSNYPPPIQYTPLTQYKANPAKDGAKASKKQREVIKAIAESPTQKRSSFIAASGTTPAVENPEATPEEPVDAPKPPSLQDPTAQWALEALSGFSEVNFDSTLAVSSAVATTLASASASNIAAANTGMQVPTSRLRSNSATLGAPATAKVIQSPFESNRLPIVEASKLSYLGVTPELRSLPLPLTSIPEPSHGFVAPVPPSPSPAAAYTAYSNAQAQQQPASFQYAPEDYRSQQAAFNPGYKGSHQQGRSVSSLRDFQMNNAQQDRLSFENASSRRGDFSADGATSINVTPAALNLGSVYQIPWLPQSRPILPPRADVNSIDVPALIGKQAVPLEPRSLTENKTDPCLQFTHLGEALRHWGQTRPTENAFASLDGKGVEYGSWDWSYTLGKAEMIAKAIHDKTQLQAGAKVALVFRLSEVLEFVAAFFGAMLAGVVPVVINQIQEFSEMVYIMTTANVELALTTQTNHKALQKDMRKGAVWPPGVIWWQSDILETWSPKNSQQARLPIKIHDLAYIEYTKSASGELKGVVVSHKGLMAQCHQLYASFAWKSPGQRDPSQQSPATETAPGSKRKEAAPISSTIMTWLEPRQQTGLLVGAIMGVFCGNFTVIMDSSITAIPGLWAHTAAAYRANVAFVDYDGLQKLLRNFRMNPQATTTPTRPDLRFLHTVYLHTQACRPKFRRDILNDYLYPLGMIPRTEPTTTLVSGGGNLTVPSTAGASASNRNAGRSDLGLIAFLSLPEHGGVVVSVRDTLAPPPGVDKIDIRKQHRKSTLPTPRRGSDGEPTAAAPAARKEGEEESKISRYSTSAMTSCEYLLHRGALRSNRVVVLATGDDAVGRMDEPDVVLVGAFGYPAVEETMVVVDPETLALSLPDAVGEIWVSSPGLPVGFWSLPEHTQEVFHAKPYIVSEENMMPTLYQPNGVDKLLRTGLLGTMIEGRLVVFGPYSGRLQQDVADPMKPIGVQYEYHHALDLSHTLFSKVGGIGEVSIFECVVNKEYLPVVCIELSKECKTNGQTPVINAQSVAVNARHFLKEVHGLRTYCIAVWDQHVLPRIFENGQRVIDHALCKKMFELGRIYKTLYLATFTDDVLFNIACGDDPVNGFWSRDAVAKRLKRQGSTVRYVQYAKNITVPEAHDEKTGMFMGKFHNAADILIWRTITQADEQAFIELDARGKEQRTITYKKFNQKLTGYAMHLEKKCGLKPGDHVILWFSQDLEFIATLHSCWVLGLIPIPLPLPDNPQGSFLTPGQLSHQASSASLSGGGLMNMPMPPGLQSHFGASNAHVSKASEERRNSILQTLFRILDEVKVKAILGNNATDDYLKQKTTAVHLRSCRTAVTPIYGQAADLAHSDLGLPPFINVTKATKTKQNLGAISGYAPRKEWFGPNYPAVYLTDYESKAGSVASRKLLKLNHETLNNLCRNQKLQFQMKSGQPLVTCLSIFSGLGFVHGCISGFYNGGPTVLVQPADFANNPLIWLEAVSRYKAQDAALSYPLLERLLARLDGNPAVHASLENLKNLMICGHGRTPKDRIMMAISRLAQLKLESDALNLIYSHPLNFMVTSQAERATGNTRIHVSSRNLRHGIVTPTSEGDDPTGIWLEDAGMATVSTAIVIVHPETMEICPANQIGEIWVHSDSTVNSYHSPAGVAHPNQAQPFGACIAHYDNRYKYMRTGDIGFLWNGQQQKLMQPTQTTQTNFATSGSFQLFVLGSMEDSFQHQGLLHFSGDIEATVESAHANVAAQGCLAFKTPQGQVICVVKVQSQEAEVLVSMYIPVMHAILEQHQFLPDIVVLVGDGVSTARRLTDGLKPRDTVCGLYMADRLQMLHRHYCHGSPFTPVLSSAQPVVPVAMPMGYIPGVDLSLTSPPGSRLGHPSFSRTPGVQAMQQQAPLVASGNRLLTSISPAPMGSGRSTPMPMQLPVFNGPPGVETQYNPNRSSLYESPLMVNIPLPPGAHNPLMQSSAAMNHAGYQPHTQYQNHGPALVPVQVGQQQMNSVPNVLSAHPPRPMSQQAFIASPPNSGSSANGGSGQGSGKGGSGGLTNVQRKCADELAMYGMPSALVTASGGRGKGGSGQQQQQQHARQLEGRSMSADELLRGDGKGSSGGGVKSFMKGVNAKITEIRKANLP